ncbi:MAG TPA: T9SS type A sorting domain-containing protein [Bacteroidia bacterium]|jgi:hypothetical protein
MKTIKCLFPLIILFSSLNGLAQSLLWDDHYQTTGVNDAGCDVHIGGDGRVYSCGTKGITNLNPDALLMSYTASGTLNWTSTYNGTSSQVDQFYALTSYGTGSSIAVYATGQATNTGTAADMLLVKYNQSGTQQWAAVWHGGGTEQAYCIDVDNSGNVYVCGRTSIGGGDIFFRKYNSSGTLQWSNTYNSSGTQDDTPKFMKINSAGSYLYITSIRTVSSTDHNAVLQKISTSTGTISWTQVWDNTLTNDIDETNWLDIDSDEVIYVVGKTQTTSNGSDALMLQYDSGGMLLLANTWNNSSYNYDDGLASVCVMEISSSRTPQIFVTGFTELNPTDNDSDVLTMKYSGAGTTPLWTNTFDGAGSGCPATNDDYGMMIMVNPTTGKVFVESKTFETSGFDFTTIKYNSGTGVQEWYDTYNGNAHDYPGLYPMDIQFEDCYFDDNIYVVGTSFEASISLYQDATTLKYGFTGPCDSPRQSDFLKNDDGAQAVISPNPFSNNATFNSGLGSVSNATFLIFDITGRETKRINNLNNSVFDFDSIEMESGIYFYKFIQNNELLQSGKLIIKK